MQVKPLARSIRATSAALALGLAATQASAIEFQSGDVTLNVYGYAQLNAVYDIKQDIGITTQAGDFGSLDFSNTGPEGHFDADAEQSLLGFTATHANGVSATLEGDFRGGSLRLRQAYGEYGNWLAGQTWSNYTSFVGFTPTLDFDGLAGNAGVQDRVAQVRYTTGPLSFSLERPAFQSVYDSGEEKQGLPVVTARYETSIAPGIAFSAGALLQQVSVDEGSGGNSDDIIGMAGFLATSASLTDTLTLHAVINGTRGANGYLYRSGNSGFGAEDAYLDGDSLEALTGYGGTIGLSANVGVGTLNLGYGFARIDWDDAEDDLGAGAVADRHKINDNAFVNYQWNPVQQVMLGVEYGYFHAENQAGDNADAHRVMFATRYSF